jgi:hypothetical protein
MSSATPLASESSNARQLHLVANATSDQGWTLTSRSVLQFFMFAAPFLVVAGLARNAGLLSSDHARLLTSALALHRDPALTTVDYGQPPLLTLLLSVWPHPIAVQYVSALIGGAVAYVLWSQLRSTQIPFWLRSLLVLSFCATPAVLLVAGMHASDMLALLLLLIAWRSYIKFVHHSITWHGFIAGLLLGLAFFSSFLTLLFVIPFALGAPSYLRSTRPDDTSGTTSIEKNKTTRRHAILAGVIVIAFPGVCALVSWMYLAWLGTGDFFHLINTFTTAGFSDHVRPNAWSLVKMTGEDLVRQPLYVFVAFLMAQRGTRQLVAHLFPLALVTVPRAFGWHYDEGFVAACYIGFAVLGLAVMTAERPNIPAQRINTLLKTGLAVAAMAQLAVAIALPLRTEEPQSWRATLIGSRDTSVQLAEEQQAFANALKSLPQGVILTDYSASQIISRAGTTHPFLLPASDQFVPAVWNPGHVVDHILLPSSPNPMDGSGLEDVRRNGVISGFHEDGRLAGWTLFTRDGRPDLFAERP